MLSQRSPAVAIIGAGPYGLSIAAHLQSKGVDFRIFGQPMHSWRAHMPDGMFLKSEGFASNLSDPETLYTLQRYCVERSLDYRPYAQPVPLETFLGYALTFQRQLVPQVEEVAVQCVDENPSGFRLRLDTGEILTVKRVVIATGISHAAHVPKPLSDLPPEFMSHSRDCPGVNTWKGCDVAVVGAGQSALEIAALLHEAGARVSLLVRNSRIQWNAVPSPGTRPVSQRLRRPMSELGPGLGPWLYSNATKVFYYLPQQVRITRAREALGPAGAWWLRERVDNQVSISLGASIQNAEVSQNKVVIHTANLSGAHSVIRADHVIAATGYRFFLNALPFLGRKVLSRVTAANGRPVLSPHFESSVKGLYFSGLAAVDVFGPAMRFLSGARFNARCVAHHIARSEHSGFKA